MQNYFIEWTVCNGKFYSEIQAEDEAEAMKLCRQVFLLEDLRESMEFTSIKEMPL